ncbi:class I SAM-dependent methyltransferase [Streptomyces beijiangensis]|uniref:Methyltransferase domain-containing protein n=1 Tax=Streptomyces beijiangensis TaxID=163361 RepID=A0A939F2X4_9ACTN|nr:class I SAM-dependent methyltransferase [Streptomyces beijiangensis]MBO0511270.1 methyltransferase domain-containing protein [Streptomyces beijiangensis]
MTEQPPHLHTTRTSYDTVAADYAELLSGLLAEIPLDRAMLTAFAELVQADSNGPVADIGCGPGRITTFLDTLGLDVSGIDLSPGMVAVAREAYPHLRFDEGSLLSLDLADGSLAGVVAWYSIIHTPPEQLPLIFAEFHRVLAPGGRLLLAFKAGDRRIHLEHAYGHDLSLDVYWLEPDHVAGLLEQAGLVEQTRVIRQPNATEKGPQAYVLAWKPGRS